MSLAVPFLGRQLKNPVIVAAGPWSRSAAAIQQSIDAGAAAVVTETITLEAGTVVRPRLYLDDGRLFNTMLYSTLDLEQWEQEMEQIDKRDSMLICSIWGATPSEAAYIASKVERMGADAVELSISAPIGTKNERLSNHSEHIGEFVRTIVQAVDIPVMVKLSYDASINAGFVRAIEESGAAAMSAIDSLKGLSGVDIEYQRAVMPTYGGYTGPNIRPVSLAVTATLSQLTRCQICGIGGIGSFQNVLEFLMLGADAVQLASAVMLHGYGRITEIVEGLGEWVAGHGGSVERLRGAALGSLIPFEEIPEQPLVSALDAPCAREDCSLCATGCLYGGVRREAGGIATDPARCTGCGLCVARCPDHKLRLVWK